MKSIAAPTTDKTIRHPAWCDPAECGEDRTGGYLRDIYHRSTPATFAVGTDDGDSNRIQLVRSDNYDGDSTSDPTVVNLRLNIESDATADELEAFGVWLVARAAEFRQAIATEGGAR